jgi:hypothetical protein
MIDFGRKKATMPGIGRKYMWWVIVGGVTCLSSRHFFWGRGLFQFENKEIGQFLKIGNH